LVVISVDPLELDWAFVEPLPKPSLNVGRSVDLRDRV
jgi:hypothetical protein